MTTLADERIERLEAALSYALTVETTNTEEWMKGFQATVNRVLVADGDHRRCTFDGQQLRLRSIRNVEPDGCKHEAVLPQFDWETAQTMTPTEVRKKFPRFHGVCPGCNEQVVVYASYEHYLSGDW